MKKIVLIIFILALMCTTVFIVNKAFDKGGIRGGDVFQNTPQEAIQFNYGELMNVVPLFDIQECDEKFCLQAFWCEKENTISCASFEKRNEKYAYIYDLEFTPDEIDYELGLVPFDIYRGCKVIFGIMLGEKSGIIINKNINAIVVPFTINDKEYKCWYAVLEGGSDAVTSVEYQ